MNLFTVEFYFSNKYWIEVDVKENWGNILPFDNQSIMIDFFLSEGAQMNTGGCIKWLKQMDYLVVNSIFKN